MRIDSAGNVGIGESSPSSFGTLVVSASNPFVVAKSTSTSNAGFSMLVNSGSGGVGAISTDNGGHMTFDTGANGAGQAERMRIDSAGNLLVGKTAASLSTAGVTAYGGSFNGLLASVRDGGEPLYLNRLTSDGSIASFQKDGTTVGSIGSSSGAYLHIGSSGATDAFIRFTGVSVPSVRPSTASGANSDAAIDLGASTARFRDLYLSGGVYLGGTGAANKLDDYEEGSWTGVSTATGTNSVGLTEYTKIGDTVHITFRVTFSGASGGLTVTGLPYSVANNAVGIGREDTTSGYAVYARILSNNNSLHFYYAGATGNATPFQVAAGQFLFNLTYKTNA
jgi:hypothetical protein